jgi:hypothetical protein
MAEPRSEGSPDPGFAHRSVPGAGAGQGYDYQGFYLTSGRFVAFTLMAVCVLGAVDIVRSGDVAADLSFLLVELAACLLAYVLGVRPAVQEEVDGLAVRNPLRTHRVSWRAVTNVDVTDVLRIHVGGTVVRCFAVPRRRPKPPAGERQLRDYGFPSTKPATRAGGTPARGPLISRADGICLRLREQAERSGGASGDRSGSDLDVTTSWATDSLVSLATGALLVVLAFLV